MMLPFKKLTIVLFSVLCFNQLKAQDFFSGSILFDLEYEGDMMEMFSAMMPSSYLFNFQESKMSFEMTGGVAALMGGMRFITDNTQGVTYMLSEKDKVAYEMKHQELQESLAGQSTQAKPEVKKLDEIITIAGYQCQKYEVITKADDGSTATQYMWVTPEIKVTQPGKYTIANMPNNFIASEEIDGFPLKIISEIVSQGVQLTMVMTASEITKKQFDSNLFDLPKDFEVKPFDSFRY